jgi:hypothetical protein
VGFDYFFDIGFGDVSVPDCIRVDHNVGTVFALIEAAGLIGADSPLQPVFCQFLLE